MKMERILNYNYIKEKVKAFFWQDIKYIYMKYIIIKILMNIMKTFFY